jgi:two-component system, NarL family, nitrate/nitrite response regulator NarL
MSTSELAVTVTVSQSNGKIRVLVADDHPVVRMGMRSYLSCHEGVEVVGEAANAREVLTKARELHPDVVFMDTYMPGMTGLVAAKLLGRQLPRTKVLMYSVHGGRDYVLQIIRSGARGYVLKNASPDELYEAVRCVSQGDTYYNTDVARLALEEYSRNQLETKPRTVTDLSEREMEVLGKIAEGSSSRAIAADFGISVRTVETHREHIMRKLQIRSIAGLVRFAIANGVAPIE